MTIPPLATITGPLTYPGNMTAVASRRITATCVGPEGAVLRDSGGGMVGETTVFTDAGGDFSIDLTLNSDIDEASGVGPPGTYWRLTVGVRPAVSWLVRLDAADADATVVIGDAAHTVVDPTPRGWVPLIGPPGALPAVLESALPSAAGVADGTRITATDSSTEFEAVGSTWVQRGQAVVEHVWQRDKSDGVNWQVITQATPGTPAVAGALTGAGSPPHAFSVVNGRGRFTGRISDGNLRIEYLLDGTNWQDSEVRSVWYAPSAIDPAILSPQMGHVHRAGTAGAVMVDQNIFGGYSSTWGANWNWNTPPDTALTIDPSAVLSWRDTRSTVIGYQVLSTTTAAMYLNSNTNFAAGDAVTFANVTGVINGSKTITAGFVNAWIIGITGGTAGAYTPCAGTCSYTAPATNAVNPKEGYPMNVASRVTTPQGGNPVTDSILEVKTWPTWAPEPVYGDAVRSITVPLVSGTTTIPAKGKCGIVVNHVTTALAAGQFVEFSNVTAKRL